MNGKLVMFCSILQQNNGRLKSARTVNPQLRHSPPFTPMLGSSLARRMTRTIPMMNHSFRMVVKRPMSQRRGFSGSPRPGSRLSSRTEVSVLLGKLSCHRTGATSEGRHFRTRDPQPAVGAGRKAQRHLQRLP